jgi:hypothetical protein
MSRTQSDRRERRNKEIGSRQALGSSTQSNPKTDTEIGSVRPERDRGGGMRELLSQ